ncbi:MAG: hypothetical protein M3Q58_04565 [Bacteroidota bacterium]|nr:hypothetical protein [Bacteroidota bacterium]
MIKWILLFLLISSNIFAQDRNTNSGFTIPRDKQLHLICGAGITTVSYLAVYKITKNKKNAFWLGLSSGILAGIAKETWDATGRGNPEVKDAVATGIGAFVPAISFAILLKNPKKKEKKEMIVGY